MRTTVLNELFQKAFNRLNETQKEYVISLLEGHYNGDATPHKSAAQDDIAAVAKLRAELASFRAAVEHVTEEGSTKRSFFGVSVFSG